MTPAAMTLVAEFEAAAKTAQAAEDELRKTLTEQVRRLERQRQFAFRRTRLIRTLAAAAHDAPVAGEEEADPWPAIWKAQRSAVRDELDWTRESKAYDDVLAELQPVGKAVWEYADAADGAQASAEVLSRLEAFEAWFERERGASFYVSFDVYVPEVPVVDF